eukprot:TRINITY_DN127_c0_g1_i1.p1 TRINITY_DN127_c0_g1~~TRINITY_DN127_c0_g1_i1.p1  ORF type:complete len:140 (-),score=0.43 TRINITY_DN127_c0_g1_i1:13-432(-)
MISLSLTIVVAMYSLLSLIIIIFLTCLACGAPWGEYSNGGAYPGIYPKRMRVVAIVQVFIVMLKCIIVATRAQLIFPDVYYASEFAIWIVLVIDFISAILNIITPSKWERIYWAPVAVSMILLSATVAELNYYVNIYKV